ncbi:hypothetical protein BpHYR1_013886 [Brachionus plicatilis]|uniref:Uncharacterized protein n=1 Tax=Brachionus plicatilis TaxID=10195 RepID=A0A3M7P821_BRAPC|nr:hypothetical protein BpHYR1_013886 [Brachionus plicatilis]
MYCILNDHKTANVKLDLNFIEMVAKGKVAFWIAVVQFSFAYEETSFHRYNHPQNFGHQLTNLKIFFGLDAKKITFTCIKVTSQVQVKTLTSLENLKITTWPTWPTRQAAPGRQNGRGLPSGVTILLEPLINAILALQITYGLRLNQTLLNLYLKKL